MAFSGGGFDTALQLGVAHALLVIHGKAPDIVVGVSAGAVNAVALAEVLQAGQEQPAGAPPPTEGMWPLHRRRMEARVRRFRQIFDASRRAPDEMAGALLPPTYQIEAQRPLEALKLPIHHLDERKDRDRALRSRAGLINLYNTVAELGISIGAATRIVRLILGWRALSEVRKPWRKAVGHLAAGARLWRVLGSNLLGIAPLLPDILRSLVSDPPPHERGASAARLIFRSRLASAVRRKLVGAASFLLLALAWLLLPLLLLLGLILMPLWRRRVLRKASFLLLALVWLQTALVPILALLLQMCEVRPGSWPWPAACGVLRPLLLAELLMLGFGALLVLLSLRRKRFLRNVLAQYGLADSLLPRYLRRQFFVDLFDPAYYGEIAMDDVVDRALRDDPSPGVGTPRQKRLREYADPERDPPIHVGLTVAEVSSGELKLLPGDASGTQGVGVVEGLLAATAVAPLFPPEELGGQLYLDGTNIANEPVRALLDYLRDRVNPRSSVVQLYSVVSLPLSRNSLGDEGKSYQTLVDVVFRALKLQRFRDATLERRLIELQTKAFPREAGVGFTANGKNYLRAWVTPIEPDAPLDVNEQLFQAPDAAERRDVIARAVADGCRAALEVMIRPSLNVPRRDAAATVLPCRVAVERHLRSRAAYVKGGLPLEDDTSMELPGSSPECGPGIVDVCRHCAIRPAAADRDGAPTHAQSLVLRQWETMGPPWPHELEDAREPAAADSHFTQPVSEYEKRSQQALLAQASSYDREKTPPVRRWPRSRAVGPGGEEIPGDRRPLVSLLFSGGVFRGVYQMGVLNALSEVKLRPDIVAGASVGSITAALVADAFIPDPGPERRARIARMAATYLALDRLVLTDRFADFIRNFTLRAADTRFSLQGADWLFRRYDSASAARFNLNARTVIAGLERLLYVSPFELKDLVEAIRANEGHRATLLLRRYSQDLLNRTGIGSEALGAEPLALIVTEHVLKNLGVSSPVPFDVFLDKSGIYFLATATNLTRGRLEILGEQQLAGGPHATVLLEALLASSAFPGVFRPRWSWEVMPATRGEHQYIDGGVMDNLPLDAVAQFLFLAAKAKLVVARPKIEARASPHLLLAASLQVDPPKNGVKVDDLRENWPELLKRARKLGYNRKLELYETAQRSIRDIWEGGCGVTGAGDGTAPLDLEVIAIRPNWLVGTFAFHPMLGFRRSQQAASIAHGCASTLLHLARVLNDPGKRDWAAGWGIHVEAVPLPEVALRPDPYEPLPVAEGECWFRKGTPCPFSRRQLEALPNELKIPSATVKELDGVYRLCGRRETHRARS